MKLHLDPGSPLPLYHQLAEALRYRIATGALPPGTVLPSLRDAARQWNVNLHTVRHAYTTLGELGLVRTEVPRGTVVLGGSRRTPGGAADRFLARMLHQARERFGLSVGEVRQRLALLDEGAGGAGETVHVIECSESQAADLAAQVSARLNLTARGWSLERPGEPPAGPLVATYFHYNDVRTRWPERFGSVRFVAIHPDPALAARVAGFRRGGRGRTTVLVCEREAAMAANIAADVRAVLPADRFEVKVRVESSPGTALAAARGGTPVLFAPRVWAALTPVERADRRAVEIRYLIEPSDLAALGDQLGARPAPSRRASSPAVLRRAVTA
jgi:DNA-binding transcriptional regulator YhcF (GntR family)